MQVVDNVTVYRFIKRLATPFNKWRAFKHGIIDGEGNILKDRNSLETRSEKDSFTKFDVLVLNIKKTMAKIPGGSTRVASYAAALYLLKENIEEFDENTFIEEFNIIMEDVPTNNVSGGAISGTNAETYTPDTKPKLVKRYKKDNDKIKEKLENE